MGFLHVFGAEAGRAAATADEAKQSEETRMERLTILAALCFGLIEGESLLSLAGDCDCGRHQALCVPHYRPYHTHFTRLSLIER